MWELDYKEGLVPKNWCFQTMVLEKTLENPLDSKDIKPVNPKGNQSWIFIGRIDVEVEAPILWPPDAKNWLIWKDADDGKDQRQEKKGTTKDEMVGWYHQMMDMSLSKEGQGSLVCCSPWGCKESDMNWLSVLTVATHILLFDWLTGHSSLTRLMYKLTITLKSGWQSRVSHKKTWGRGIFGRRKS